jgi:hypothetical protein
MTGLLRNAGFLVVVVAGCLVVTFGAASLGLRRAAFEHIDTATASSLAADYSKDARSELSPPLLAGIIDAAAEDEVPFAPGANDAEEPPRSPLDQPEAQQTRLATSTPPAGTATAVASTTAAPTPGMTATPLPTVVASVTPAPPSSTPVPPKPTDTPRPTATPTRIINLPCVPPLLPGEILDGVNDVIRPTCTPKPTSTPAPKLSPTPTRTPIIDILPNDWPLLGGL